MNVEQLTEWMNEQRDLHPTRLILPHFKCPDGFMLSIQASDLHYCSPREKDLRQYNSVELGYPSEPVEALLPYAEDANDPTCTVYGWVPLALVADVLTAHGA